MRVRSRCSLLLLTCACLLGTSYWITPTFDRLVRACRLTIITTITQHHAQTNVSSEKLSDKWTGLDKDLAGAMSDPHANATKKGDSFPERHKEIMSDPSNLFLPRCQHAGKVKNGRVVLHNGIVVTTNGYYGAFSHILQTNRGVHEPAEERLMGNVIAFMPEGAVMIELGAYWAYYSIWFAKAVKGARNYCVEPNRGNMQVGLNNTKINGVHCDWTQAFVGKKHLKVSKFVVDKAIDHIEQLHVDIQGSEVDVIDDIADLLDRRKISYLFVSTHSQKLHMECLKNITAHGYRIIGSQDFDNQTFSFDGIIIASQAGNLELPTIDLGDRSHTPLRNGPFGYVNQSQGPCQYLPDDMKDMF